MQSLSRGWIMSLEEVINLLISKRSVKMSGSSVTIYAAALARV